MHVRSWPKADVTRFDATQVLKTAEPPESEKITNTWREKMCEVNMTLGLTRFGKLFFLIICLAPLYGCGGGSLSPSVPPPVANQSPGGIWTGVDSTGQDIVALVTETGRFHFIADASTQGTGILSVSNGNDVAGNFDLVTEFGLVFPDGTTLASCMLSGTVRERQTFTLTVNCTTTAGLQTQTTAALNYEPLYDRDSSLTTIAGMFDDGSGIVTTIFADGTIFGQDPVFGCVTNGQVSIINSAFNAYDFEFGISNCTGQAAIFNGATFVGLGTLDSTGSPEFLFVGAIGVVNGVLISTVSVQQRI